MKKTILLSLTVAALALSSCNDMLEKSPRDTPINDPAFWQNENLVSSYCNTFFEDYSGYGTGTGGGWYYFKTLSDDQVRADFEDWTFTSVPQSSSYWTSGHEEVRRANYAITMLAGSSMANKTKYIAIARLNRAWQYYQLVRMYGDVQWRNTVVLDPNNTEETKMQRTDRDVVMDSVLNDLDFAIANLPAGNDKNSFTPAMAQAMKSDICLYEGTYCKYRTQADNGKAPDEARASKYLQESVKASEAVMGMGYSLTADYGTIYNSVDLSGCNEIIFYRNYEKDVQHHSTVDWTSSSSQQYGITRNAVESFLFRDGKPLATTTLNKSDLPKPVIKAYQTKKKDGSADSTAYDTIYTINNMTAVRDKRLGVLLDSVLCFKGHSWKRGYSANDAAMTSSTAYNIGKYDTPACDFYYRGNTGTNYTDAPIYWLAVIYLNYAEAKAELGTISQSDLDNTINKLEARAGLPNLTMSPAADPANNMNVSSLLWEIRRCRRCELMTDNWYRYWDLVRWHQLDKLDTGKYPSINEGANLSQVPHLDGALTLSGGYVKAVTSKVRTFDKKYYFFPVPTNEVQTSGCSQNPDW